MRYETVFLDAGGVLVNPNWNRVAETLGRHGVEVDALRLATAEAGAKQRLDAPEPVAASNDSTRGWLYFNLVLEGAGLALSDRTRAALAELAEYHARWNLWESVPDDVPGALRRLRGSGRKLVVVSNSNGTVATKLERLGLLTHFDHVVDSHHEGVEKPDPRLFRIALERAGARAESTLHAGDLYHVDVVGARAAGLQAWLVDPAGLYRDYDCPRVCSLTEMADQLGAAGD